MHRAWGHAQDNADAFLSFAEDDGAPGAPTGGRITRRRRDTAGAATAPSTAARSPAGGGGDDPHVAARAADAERRAIRQRAERWRAQHALRARAAATAHDARAAAERLHTEAAASERAAAEAAAVARARGARRQRTEGLTPDKIRRILECQAREAADTPMRTAYSGRVGSYEFKPREAREKMARGSRYAPAFGLRADEYGGSVFVPDPGQRVSDMFSEARAAGEHIRAMRGAHAREVEARARAAEEREHNLATAREVRVKVEADRLRAVRGSEDPAFKRAQWIAARSAQRSIGGEAWGSRSPGHVAAEGISAPMSPLRRPLRTTEETIATMAGVEESRRAGYGRPSRAMPQLPDSE